ncbi:MAG: extracellular solute-binding protein [Firmicutes bacterium]|nr:extracellular solute-binding protein [Bacillota bacterium]
MKKLVDSGISPKGVLSYQEDDAQNVFRQGNAVFMRNWPYAWALNQASNSPVKGKIGVAPLPTGPSGTTPYSCLGGWNLAINSYSKHPDQAWTFIQYMMSPQVQKEIALGASYEGTYKAIYQDPDVIKANPFFKDLYNVLVNTKPRPVTPYYPQISQSLQNHVSAALAGSETPQPALDAAANEIQTAINQ